MITNPKDFFQQIKNLCEELALQVQLIRNRLSEFLTVGLADSTYLKKSEKASAASTADTAARATADSDGSKFSTTYLKRSDADNKYLGKYEKAESAKTADRATTADSATTASSATTAGSATKATQDGNGKNIAATYATVASLNTTNTNVTTAQTTANDAKTLAEGALPKTSITISDLDLEAGVSALPTGSIHFTYE